MCLALHRKFSKSSETSLEFFVVYLKKGALYNRHKNIKLLIPEWKYLLV